MCFSRENNYFSVFRKTLKNVFSFSDDFSELTAKIITNQPQIKHYILSLSRKDKK